MKKIERFVVVLAVALAGITFALLFLDNRVSSIHAQSQSNDKSPMVKITAPENHSAYSWDTQVNYSIVVTDHGKSTKYQEIPANQVLLKTTYVPDLSQARATTGTDPAGLLDIMNSNCLGCHGLKSASTGPSFAAIGKRYPNTPATIDTLSQHIRQGVVGIWGQEPMPPHPDLTQDELHTISKWILEDAANPKVSYYVGTEGAFRMQSPAKPDPKAGMVLTASYVSHGTNHDAQHALRGEDTIAVAGK